GRGGRHWEGVSIDAKNRAIDGFRQLNRKAIDRDGYVVYRLICRKPICEVRQMAFRGRNRVLPNRRSFIGGSDAWIIMGSDEAALIRLWREKRGEGEPEDLSGNLIVQVGAATEGLNRTWDERNTRRHATDPQPRGRPS